MKNKFLTAAMVGGILLLGACDKEQDANNPSSQKGSMDVHMTDAPANFDALILAVSEVEVYQEGKGWVTLSANAETFNVLELNNGTSKKIANSTTLEAGVYSKIRLVFDQEVKLTTISSVGLGHTHTGGTFNMKWQGSNTIEIEINETVEAGGTAEILLDFDAAKSIIEATSEYFIAPVIRYVDDKSTGIAGQVDGSGQGMILVSNGWVEASATYSIDGAFEIQGLKNGNYEMQIEYLILANGVMEYRTKTIDVVTVTEGQVTQMGMITLE